MRIKDVRDKLPKNGEYPKREIGDITHIDIHHSASLTSSYKGFETVKGFANYHINGHGWQGLGYHYVVPPKDDILKTGYANEMRWSVRANNSYTISIMIIGSFDKETISKEQYQKALELARTLMKAYNIPRENVMGHNEYPNQNTACPGIDMDKFRSDL